MDPAGYTERYGEWVKITNPVVRGIQFADVEGVVHNLFRWHLGQRTTTSPLRHQITLMHKWSQTSLKTCTPNPDPAKDWVFNYTRACLPSNAGGWEISTFQSTAQTIQNTGGLCKGRQSDIPSSHKGLMLPYASRVSKKVGAGSNWVAPADMDPHKC